jgi:hypothetical protein
VAAAWLALALLWTGPYFLSFQGFTKGLTWRNPLARATCGLEKAPFPNTCGERGPRDGDASGAHTDPRKQLGSSCEALADRVATARERGSSALVDDLETGDAPSDWFAVNDGSGQQFPLPCAIRSPLAGERGTNNAWAMHTYGFSAAGFQWAMIGRHLRGPLGCKAPIDARGFSGIRFWAKGPGTIRVAVATVVTTALEHGGTCRALCYDNHQTNVELSRAWATYEVPFGELVQLGYGTPVQLDPSQILDVTWGPVDSTGFGGQCFDFWIDDVAFYR